MSTEAGLFWDDLKVDLEDPDFRAEFVLRSIRIATIDRIMGELDDVRVSRGLSKAALARSIEVEPAVVRRLFSERRNPTVGTLTSLAAALGMEVTLTRMPKSKARRISAALAGSEPGRRSRRASAKARSARARRPASGRAAAASLRD